MFNPKTATDQEIIENAENAIAFFDIVYGTEFTEEEMQDARVARMIRIHTS